MALTKINASVIANNTIAVGNIADNSVDATKIASNSILTRHIDDDQVTGAQLADNIDIAGTFDVTGATTLDAGLTVDTTTLVVDATNNRVGIGTTSPLTTLHVEIADTDASLFVTDTRAYNTSDNGGVVAFGGKYNSSNAITTWGQIHGIKDDNTDGTFAGHLKFLTRTTGALTERMRIDSSGNVGIGETTPLASLHIKQGDSGLSSLNAAAHHIFLEDTGSNGPGMTMASGTSSNCTLAFGDSDSNYRGFMLYDNSADSLKFGTAGTERMRLQSDGKLLVTEIAHISGTSGNLEIGNGDEKHIMHSGGYHQFQVADTEIIRVNGEGIAFNGDSAAANSLDDYEEGTWTPTLSSGSISVSAANYVKIGRFIHVNTYFTFSSLTNDGNVFRINGLPYNCTSGNHYGGGVISYSHAANTADLQPLVASGNNYIYFHETDGVSAVVTQTNAYSRFANGAGYILVNMSYMTT